MEGQQDSDQMNLPEDLDLVTADEGHQRDVVESDTIESYDIIKDESLTSPDFEFDTGQVVEAQYPDLSDAFKTDEVFTSREDVTRWVINVGRTVGVAIVIAKSDTSGRRRTARIVFACERSGKYREHKKNPVKKTTKPPTGSKKCGCPFTLRASRMRNEDRWAVTVLCGLHNHQLMRHPQGHSYAGRLTMEEKEILKEMSKSGVKPRDILNALKGRDAHNASTMRTIYNGRSKLKAAQICGRSVMQELFQLIVEHKYVKQQRVKEKTDTLRDLFWAHPESIKLANCFPHLFLLDRTYITNRHKLPLMEIVGVTSTNKTFTVAFVYLEAAREDNFVWALECMKSILDPKALPSILVTSGEVPLMNAVRRVYPSARNFLCRFHIYENIVTNCKKMFDRKEVWNKFLSAWNELVLSGTEGELWHRQSEMESEFSEYPAALEFVRDSWLSKYKESFVAAWTDQSMHLGNTTTNRAEGAHERLKGHLATTHGDFIETWTTIDSLLVLQHTEIVASFEMSLHAEMHTYRPEVFELMKGFVSKAALDILHTEVRRSDSIGPYDRDACGCLIRSTHGLPCAHEIAQYKREGRPIPLSCIHQHWKKLSNQPVLSLPPDPDYRPDLELFVKKFEESILSIKIDMLTKLREIVGTPSTAFVEPEPEPEPEPEVKPRGRGRPKGSFSKKSSLLESSRKRDPSALEIVLGLEGYQSQSPPSKIREKLNVRHCSQTNDFLNEFPPRLRTSIYHVKDVEHDGNCGFRAVAAVLGMGEGEWIRVRREMIEELADHREDYYKLYGGQMRVGELISSLSHFESPAPYASWMTMPDMGHIIASRYNIVLLHISMQQSLTFLPLRSNPPPSPMHNVQAIGLVNGDHFVQLVMAPGCPVPPIACEWYVFRQDQAQGWAAPYAGRINMFREALFESKEANCETPIKVE